MRQRFGVAKLHSAVSPSIFLHSPLWGFTRRPKVIQGFTRNAGCHVYNQYVSSSGPFLRLPNKLATTHGGLEHPEASQTNFEDGPLSKIPQPSLRSDSLEALETCHGCGAFAQFVDAGVAGYYDLNRSAVKHFIGYQPNSSTTQDTQNKVYVEAMRRLSPELRSDIAESPKEDMSSDIGTSLPLCDRCHNLLHHHSGIAIEHPSLDSLWATLAESPWSHNHIYHVIDAADFPLSLIPNIQQMLSIAPQRSRNRRARQARFVAGKRTELTFIITRSDLLAPKKEQVDRLMPYLVATLRDALGRSAEGVRLGNVRCVSAKRGWWTKEVKESIWKRGGGGWMLGKVNVGKSNLFESIFPKGRNHLTSSEYNRNDTRSDDSSTNVTTRDLPSQDVTLLPPRRRETLYPQMPTISALPGTTASPIRIPFGNGRGELIDLPGLERSCIDDFVREDCRERLIMKKRIVPEQYSIQPGHSLLLGGLVRVASVETHVNILAYPFTPLDVHVGKTSSASSEQRRLAHLSHSIAKEGVTENLESTGTFELKWDVTKQRAGPLVARDAVGLKPQNLPFKVLSTDILIESVGWIELVAQVRRKDFPDDVSLDRSQRSPPAVEIFSPQASFINSRSPMGAYELGKPKVATNRKRIQPINRKLKERRSRSQG